MVAYLLQYHQNRVPDASRSSWEREVGKIKIHSACAINRMDNKYCQKLNGRKLKEAAGVKKPFNNLLNKSFDNLDIVLLTIKSLNHDNN